MVLSVLYRTPLDDDETDILIHDQDSDNWGRYKYSELSECPVEERKKYDLLINHSDDVVHWWRQLGLNRECVKSDLQKLSRRGTYGDGNSKQSPLLAFKCEYEVLCKYLYAVFGLMISNSHLCEQIHGMLRHGMCSTTGMDQLDVQQSFATSTNYETREEHRDLGRLLPTSEPPPKGGRVDSNATKQSNSSL